MKTVYDFVVKDRKGNDVSLKDYEGKVLLIVNTATGCGFTPHYEPLEAMYKEMRDKGFEILDFRATSLQTRHLNPMTRSMSSALSSSEQNSLSLLRSMSMERPQIHCLHISHLRSRLKVSEKALRTQHSISLQQQTIRSMATRLISAGTSLSSL